MPAAGGEFVKVYLYVCAYPDATSEQIADALNMTEKDVKRAVIYWENTGAKFSQNDDQHKSADLTSLEGDDEFRALLFGLQQYLSRTFSYEDTQIIGYMYDNMKMAPELIEYLFELCIGKGKKSLRYMEKVAQGWYEKGIDTVEKAREDNQIFMKEINEVKASLGIKDRELATRELNYIGKWFRDMKLSQELVNEACARAVIKTAKPSFAYADGILKKWSEAGIDSLEKVEAMDKAYEEDSKSKKVSKANSDKTGNPNKTTGTNNSFHNFEQREGDLDADVMDKFNDLFK